MRLEEFEGSLPRVLENSVSESYSEKSFPVKAGLFSDYRGFTSLSLALTGLIIIGAYAFLKYIKRRK